MPLRLRTDDRIPDKRASTAFGELSVAIPTPKVQIVFPYNVNSEIVTGLTVASGTISVTNNMCSLATGTNSSGSAEITSVATLKYNPGQGALARFTAVFGTPAAQSTQYVGIVDSADGFAFGYTGTQFGIMHRSSGAETWYPQSGWITDQLNGSGPSGMLLDPKLGNVYQIQFQWLGFGEVRFFIEDDSRGVFQNVHRIRYANKNTVPSISNPTLPITARVVNYGNTGAITLKTPSLAAFVEGTDQSIVIRKSTSATKTGVGTTEIPVLTVGNSSTFSGATNKVSILVDFASVATNVANPSNTVRYRLLQGTSLTGQASYTYTAVSPETSVANINTTATGIIGGVPVLEFVTAGSGNMNENLSGYNIFLYPGKTMTLTAISSAASNSTVTAALSWRELF